MSSLPSHLKYSKTHEWLKLEGQEATIGITDHAQELLGDLVYVELPEVGSTVTMGAEIAVVESVKAASDVYSPISGVVTAANSDLATAPELVNQSPYEKGWLFKLKLSSPQELEQLLSATDYQKVVDAEGH